MLLAVPLFAWLVYPVGVLLFESFTLPVLPFRAKLMGWDPQNQPFASAWQRMFVEPVTRDAIVGTITISVLSALASCVWGAGLALLWFRRDFPGRRFFAAIGYAPLLMPPLVGTLAFFRLIGEGGLLWAWLGFKGSPPISGFGQVLLMHTYSFGLYTYAYVSAALEGADHSREEAARSLGAGWLRTFWTAVFPVMRLPLLASALLILMASAASFSAPYILDNTSRYLTVEIVRENSDDGLQRAMTAALALLSLSLLPVFLVAAGQGRVSPEAAYGLKGTARRSMPPCSPPRAMSRIVLSILASIILLAPPVLVLIAAFNPAAAGAQSSGGMFSILTSLTRDDLSSLGRSAWYAGVAAAIDIVFALFIALALRRRSFWAALPVEIPVMLALALPGSAVAVALLSAFNAPSWLTFGMPMGQTAAILIMAYAIRNLPMAVRPARAALESVGTELELAAAGLGARPWSVKWRVVIPLILPSLLAAFLVCFINGAGEFVASRLLFGVHTMPVSLRIDELYRNYPGPAYGLSLCLMLMSAAAIALAAWLQRRFVR